MSVPACGPAAGDDGGGTGGRLAVGPPTGGGEVGGTPEPDGDGGKCGGDWVSGSKGTYTKISPSSSPRPGTTISFSGIASPRRG